MDLDILVILVWVLCGVLPWWLVVRYRDRELTARNLAQLPIFAAMGPGCLFLYAINHACSILATNKTYKSWKDKK
jgi:hypothetical protein